MNMQNTVNAPAYLHLKWGAKKRLENLRLTAARKQLVPDWRKARQWGYHNWASACGDMSPGFNTENQGTTYERRTPVMYCYTGEQFRNEKNADEVEGAYIDHNGWYSNADCDQTYRAFIFNLPHGRFGCGYTMSVSGERVYFMNVFHDAAEAAQFADSEAECMAEVDKEYSERWQAAQDLKADIELAEKVVRESYALRNVARFDYVRDEVREAIDNLRELREKLADEYADIEE